MKSPLRGRRAGNAAEEILSLESILGTALNRTLALDHILTRAVELCFDRTSARELSRVRDLDRDLTQLRNRVRSLKHVRHLTHDRDSDVPRERAIEIVRDLDRLCPRARNLAPILGRDLDQAICSATLLARELAREHRDPVRVAPAAGRLLTVTTLLLPALERGRYADEFRSELDDLAAGGTRRWGQLGYAARQLRSVWRLRAALRDPEQERAAP